MNKERILYSTEDLSVNFITEKNIGFLEARYVRRSDDYFIIYLSSQTGCIKSCRMCHLTATGQNKYQDTTPNEFVDQAIQVYSHYDKQKNTPLVHYNFMARGEPLDNPFMIKNSDKILLPLQSLARERGLESKFLISTIMPDTIENSSLIDMFQNQETYPEIYYSIYSIKEDFRKRWLPRSISVDKALDKLVEWQQKTEKTPKIHFAFIKNENDNPQDVLSMCQVIKNKGLKVNFNIVRYNSFSPKYGEESSEDIINQNVEIMINELKPEQHRIVPKVGFDVKASCGMFIK